MATNTIFERPDGYAVYEREADVVLTVPISAVDTFSAYLKPYGNESRDASRAYWSIAKTSSEGIAAISHVVQTDVKNSFRLSAPATPLPTSNYQVVPMMLDPYGRFELVDYTEKSFALFTNEEFGKTHAVNFRSNGTYNSNLKQYASRIGTKGWIFGKRNDASNTMLSQLTGIDIVAYLAQKSQIVTSSPLQPASPGRSIPQIAIELLTALSTATGINEYESPSSDNTIRVILWGSESEVKRRYELLEQEHRDHDIRPELSATIGQAQITIAIWNGE